MLNLKDKIVIAHHEPVRKALQLLNDIAVQGIALLVTDDENRITGTLTDGDIRRALLGDHTLQTPVGEVANRNFRYISEHEPDNGKLQKWRGEKILFVPVLDKEHRLVSVLDLARTETILPFEAVLMAGGAGQRLRPLTENLPKPLLKVGDVPIIERNIIRLARYGVSHFYISIRYLGEKIREYLGDGSRYQVKIDYISEDEPLGTAGALHKIPVVDKQQVLLMNSDLLTNIDFADFYRSFETSGADMTVATVPYHVDIPYAVIETDDKQKVISLHEKPRYTYYSNAGIYLIKRDLIDLVPAGEKFDATDLMEKVVATGRRLTTYPIVGYWLDIGRIDDYKKAQEDIRHIQF